MGKEILRTLLFFGIFAVLFAGLNHLMAPKDTTDKAGMHEAHAKAFLAEPENTVDVVILGNSEAYRGVAPLTIWEEYGITAYSTGGRISNANRSVLVGEKAISDVCAYHADIAFFSASSIGQNGEIFDCFEEENVIRSYMLKNATKKVLLGDNTKFGKSGQFRLCSVKDVDYIVTDQDRRDWFTVSPLPEIIF
jgi:hypothetical protein